MRKRQETGDSDDREVPISQTRVHGDMVYVSGQIGVDAETREAPEDFEQEVRCAIERLAAQLEATRASLDTVLKATVFIRHEQDFDRMNAIYAEYFRDLYPARSTLVTALAEPSVRFEIEAIAHVTP